MSYESLHTQGHVASTEVFPSRVLLVESGPWHRRCQPGEESTETRTASKMHHRHESGYAHVRRSGIERGAGSLAGPSVTSHVRHHAHQVISFWPTRFVIQLFVGLYVHHR